MWWPSNGLIHTRWSCEHNLHEGLIHSRQHHRQLSTLTQHPHLPTFTSLSASPSLPTQSHCYSPQSRTCAVCPGHSSCESPKQDRGFTIAGLAPLVIVARASPDQFYQPIRLTGGGLLALSSAVFSKFKDKRGLTLLQVPPSCFGPFTSRLASTQLLANPLPFLSPFYNAHRPSSNSSITSIYFHCLSFASVLSPHVHHGLPQIQRLLRCADYLPTPSSASFWSIVPSTASTAYAGLSILVLSSIPPISVETSCYITATPSDQSLP